MLELQEEWEKRIMMKSSIVNLKFLIYSIQAKSM